MLIKEALNQDWLLTRQTALRKKVLKKKMEKKQKP